MLGATAALAISLVPGAGAVSEPTLLPGRAATESSAPATPTGTATTAAASEADVPVAGRAEPTLTDSALAQATVVPAGASVAAGEGGTLAGLPSRVLPTGEARMIGLTWTGTAPDAVELRSQNPDGTWTAWNPVDAADGDDEVSKGTDAVWIGASQQIEVRAARGSQDASADLTAVLIETPTTTNEAGLDTNPDATLATTGGAQVAASYPLPVPVISRAGWGADESLRSGSPSYSRGVLAATVHHTASTNSYSKSQSAAQVRGFYAYHTRTLGWSDIGYNALVDKYGQVFEGRAGGLAQPVIGAHAAGFNSNTFGISMIGTYSTVTPPAATVEAVSQMIAWKFRISGISSPWGTVGLTSQASSVKYAYGTTANLPRIFGHRDTGYTTCPGNAGYAKLPAIRSRVAALLTAAPPAPTPTVPPVQVPSLKGNQQSALSDGSYRVIMQTDGNLVIYNKANTPVWSSQTYLPGGYLSVQGDGNLVISNANGVPRWHTNTGGRSAGKLLLQGDGNLVLYIGSTPVWDRFGGTKNVATRFPTVVTGLGAGQGVTSLNGAYTFNVQRDGNMTVYSGGRMAWASMTFGSSPWLSMQGDGNLVLYGSSKPLWYTSTAGRAGATALFDDAGRLQIYQNGVRVWPR